MVFGGFDGTRRNDVWALPLGGQPVWEPLTSTTPGPTPRLQHAAIYDAVHQRMVVFGGQTGSGTLSKETWALDFEVPTPTLATLVDVEAHSDLVRLTWEAPGAAMLRAFVSRRVADAGDWTMRGTPSVDGDRLVFEDREVVPGTRYGYQLAIQEGGGETLLDPVWITVPVHAELALTGASPNPAARALTVAFSLPDEGAATLELFDLRGRRLAREEVGGLGAGEHRVTLADARAVPAGVYLVRLVRGDRMLTVKACVIR